MVELRLKWDKKEDVGWNTEKLRSRSGIMGVGKAALGMVLISDGIHRDLDPVMLQGAYNKGHT